MPLPRLDLTGRRFGRWTVLAWAGRSARANHHYWRCRCDCGAEREIQGDSLRRGASTSCGCYRAEQLTIHAHAGPGAGEYSIWRGIKARCYNPAAPGYAAIGGRGIRMARGWREDFARFLHDVGPRPSPAHRLRRIRSDRDYTSANCAWVISDARRRR